jgi:hypothetical protein
MSWASAATGDVTGIDAGDGIRIDNGSSATPDVHIDIEQESAITIVGGDQLLVSDANDSHNIGNTTLTAIAALFAGDDLTAATGVIGVDDSFIQNDEADTMAVTNFGAAACLTIDANQPATAAAENSTGLHVDYDRIVAASGTANHNDIGIDLDVNAATLGTGTVTGMDIDVVGAASGTHTAIGIDMDVDTAGTNIGMQINTAGTHIKLVANADTSDYATIALADTGDLTVTTVGSGTTDSDLTFTIDGSLIVAGATGIDIGAVSGGLSPVTNIKLDGGTF